MKTCVNIYWTNYKNILNFFRRFFYQIGEFLPLFCVERKWPLFGRKKTLDLALIDYFLHVFGCHKSSSVWKHLLMFCLFQCKISMSVWIDIILFFIFKMLLFSNYLFFKLCKLHNEILYQKWIQFDYEASFILWPNFSW